MLTLKVQHSEAIRSRRSQEKTHENEREMVVACKNGQARAQQELYETLAPYIMVVCCRYLKNEEDARDALQECFIKAFSAISRFKMDSSIKTWVTRIAVNHCINMLKKQKALLSLSENKIEPVWTPSKEEEQRWEELNAEGCHFRNVLETMNHLPEGYRTVLNLYALEGYSHEEIAGLLDISVGTSKSQLARARRKLKELMLESPED